MIYLDYSATTPTDSDVLDTFVKASKYIGNANSLHRLGSESKQLIDASIAQIANLLHVRPSEVIFTSGASESNNTAIKGICFKYANRGKTILTTKLEHSSILEPIRYLVEQFGFQVQYLDLDADGVIDLSSLKEKLNDDVLLVSVASVSSELGISQPIREMASIIKEYPKCFFHVDMTQSVGKEKVSFDGIDLASFSAHKFYGVKGIGCLIKKESVSLTPLIHGGKSTTVYRSGTPATALIASLAKALRLAYENFPEKLEKIRSLHDYLISCLKEIPEVHLNSTAASIPQIVNFSVSNIKSETLLHALETHEIYISTKTACSSDVGISDSVYAVTGSKEYALHSLRVSISHLTTKDELEEFVRVLKKCIRELSFQVGEGNA